jgi:hypothetical protein
MVKLSAAERPRGRDSVVSMSDSNGVRATHDFQQFCYLKRIEQRARRLLIWGRGQPTVTTAKIESTRN